MSLMLDTLVTHRAMIGGQANAGELLQMGVSRGGGGVCATILQVHH